MSFGLPSVKVKPEHAGNIPVQGGPFGIASPLVAGFGVTKNKLGMSHPLQASEQNYHLNEEKMNMSMLRNIQGCHAPMKLSMERKFASKVGRLPFLPSSNLQHDVFTGRYLDIGFEDILNTPEFCEISGQPHAMVERSLGIL
ncbi:proteasome maturation protein [Pararge aegeria]|uniref:Jg26118 protein n=2 Tax=Pararge aegeria TaxID=116150 RepID=A0A8S4SDN3_9NEOP|nr:proteasome maturation protein [Pararge aegeria]CAH2257316.1 jg26118 [Pararge aegeria aegeria]